MDHKIKMIGFDLDGTLLTTDKKLTDYTRQILDEALEKGVFLLPVTGRPLSGLPDVMKAYPGMHYAIVSNGARVVKDGVTIHERLLPLDKAREIVKIMDDYDCLCEIYYDGQGYADEKFLNNIEHYHLTPVVTDYITSTRIGIKDVWAKFNAENRDLDKVQGIFADAKEQAEAWKRIEALGDVEATGALSTNIEVNAGGVHKGVALRWFAEQFDIKPEEIMAFGDGSNDTMMIKEVGIGVAMENGIPAVKEVADLIAPSNDEDGVAQIIKKYVLDEKE